jgi:hypothetical protein
MEHVAAPIFESASHLIEHLSGLRPAHPLVRTKFISALASALNAIKAIDQFLFDPSYTSQSSYYLLFIQRPLQVLHGLLEILYSSSSPRHPYWLHYYLVKRLQDFTGEGHIHLIVAPIHNDEEFAYFQHFTVLKELLENGKKFIEENHDVSIIPLAIRDYQPDDDLQVVLQCMPWFADQYPHFASISMHELAHHIFRYKRPLTLKSGSDKVNEFAKRYVEENPTPGNFEKSCLLHNVPVDPEDKEAAIELLNEFISAELSENLEEIWADTFAVWRLGPSLYFTFRDHIMGLEENSIPDLKDSSIWTFDPAHPPHIIRLANLAKLSNLSLDEETKKFLGLSGGLFDYLVTTPWPTFLNAAKAAIPKVVKGSEESKYWKSDIIKQIIAEQQFYCETIINCVNEDDRHLYFDIYQDLKECCEAARIELKFPKLSRQDLERITKLITSYAPATNIMKEIAHPFSHIFAIAYKLFDQNKLSESGMLMYSAQREVIIKSIEDYGMVELYAHTLDT